MRRKDLELVDFIPGTAEKRRKKLSEWVCPECDYFEEIEKDEEGRLTNPDDPTGRQG